MNLGVFCCLFMMKRNDHFFDNMEDLSGLSKNHPIISICLLLLLFSLAGIPPLAGFFAKFYIFSAAIEEGFVTLVVIAVLNSAISFYYYLKVVVFMYMKEPNGEFQISLTPMTLFVVIVGIIGTVELGIFPDPIIALTNLH